MTFSRVSPNTRFQMPDRMGTGLLDTYCTLQITTFFILFLFYILKVCSHPTLSKSVGTICLKPFVCFVSLGHILVILEQYFKIFYYYISYNNL